MSPSSAHFRKRRQPLGKDLPRAAAPTTAKAPDLDAQLGRSTTDRQIGKRAFIATMDLGRTSSTQDIERYDAPARR